MESAHPFSVSFAPCFQGILCRSRLFSRMFLDKLFQICADRFIMKQKRRCFSPFLLSPSSRRAWIEIRRCTAAHRPLPHVALLAEGVDRNFATVAQSPDCTASPSSRRAWIEMESNKSVIDESDVALLAEGVDRNYQYRPDCGHCGRSPSSRRAWIEISWSLPKLKLPHVALLAEGVDRNTSWRCTPTGLARSPSSRRAWIEIPLH